MADLDRAQRVALGCLPSNLSDVARAIAHLLAKLEQDACAVRHVIQRRLHDLEAGVSEHARIELADALYLVLDAARSLGVTPDLLAELVRASQVQRGEP